MDPLVEFREIKGGPIAKKDPPNGLFNRLCARVETIYVNSLRANDRDGWMESR